MLDSVAQFWDSRSLSRRSMISIAEFVEQVLPTIQYDCSYSKLTTLSDISYMWSVTFINCSINQITLLPYNIGDFKTLVKLDCSDNQLIIIPDSIGDLEFLEHFDCSDNQLTVLPESIGNLKSLRYFNCAKNGLSELPDAFEKLSSLRDLNIAENRFRELPGYIGGLQTLVSIDCSCNQIGELPQSIRHLHSLDKFVCFHNRLKTLTDLPLTVKCLWASNNLFDYDYLQGFKKMQELSQGIKILEKHLLPNLNKQATKIQRVWRYWWYDELDEDGVNRFINYIADRFNKEVEAKNEYELEKTHYNKCLL